MATGLRNCSSSISIPSAQRISIIDGRVYLPEANQTAAGSAEFADDTKRDFSCLYPGRPQRRRGAHRSTGLIIEPVLLIESLNAKPRSVGRVALL
jgi:hypothetical protein